MTLKKEDLPDTISQLTLADVDLLMEAIRSASQQDEYMNDPETSFRLGWIVGMLRKEVLERTSLRN